MKYPRLLLLFAGMLQIGFTPARADVLDNWTTNQISTNTFGLKHVVYGNGCYVAVGEYSDSGGIYSSADGFNWTLRYNDPNSWGLTLAYSGGHFVGVGGWVTISSTDGTNWTGSLLPDQFGFIRGDITYGNGVYVIVGSTNNVSSIRTSTGGSTWTDRSINVKGGYISSVAYGTVPYFPGTQPWFVALGNNDGFFYTSSTGTSWIRRSIPGGSQVSYGNGLFFVPLTSQTNLVSSDGINWSQYGTGLTNQLGKIIYANGIFLARSGNYLATSSDGTNWVQYSQPIPGGEVATDGKRLVTVGYTGSFYYNGFTFTSEVLAGVRMTNNPSPKVALFGLVGRNYQIQSADSLNGGWSTRTTLQLPATPYVWTDSTATNSARFYRGVLLP